MEDNQWIVFLGAAGDRQPLPACTLGKNILIDCGMEQGGDTYETRAAHLRPGVDCVVLTTPT